jgi:hypothetical protein
VICWAGSSATCRNIYEEIHAPGGLSAAAAVTTLMMINITSRGGSEGCILNIKITNKKADHSHHTQANPDILAPRKIQISTMAS